MNDKETGIVKWFNSAKGFGFISFDGGKEAFVHYSDLKQDGYRCLKEGQQVEFALENADRGLKATDVKLAESEQSEVV